MKKYEMNKTGHDYLVCRKWRRSWRQDDASGHDNDLHNLERMKEEEEKAQECRRDCLGGVDEN